MLPQALKMSGRSAFPLLRCADRWVDVMPAPASRQVKTLEQMPGPSAAGFIWDLFLPTRTVAPISCKLEGRRKYGPMWKASFGPILTVHVAEPELIEQVLRQEGQHPMRSDLSSWKDYRKLRGEGYGLLTAGGVAGVVRSLLGKATCCRLKCGGRISSVLFESRIGCLDPVVPVETERFIQSINTMFVMTLLTMAMPQWLHRLLPKPWETFCGCWDYMFQFAKGHIEQRLEEERQKMARGERLEGRYLTYFLSQTGVPLKSVYSNVTELLLAGVDTISGTLSWSLYELSRHPDVQTALREEVLSVMKGRSIPEARDVAAMPLMKAVMKEILRLYPVIPANARVIPDKDITVGGYLYLENHTLQQCIFKFDRETACSLVIGRFLRQINQSGSKQH
ncbi:hypothetical protein QQF64_025935 [Cirrhinus molitorella]|uniref:25-hydroxyvitamin D-1 alpha hydroxylase, mitochondrial n=1 Tax=Cirrhinus molitorella TaxID=172907 RepID=A0ABR3NQV8_9TELE